MNQLTRQDLWSLEQYSERRQSFRAEVMMHKKNRQITLGTHARFCFEDQLTMRYQIQEMLRIERIFEAGAIQEELDTYNPLVPDGRNLKATFMLEYDDIDQRKVMLQKLRGVEKQLWLEVEDMPRITPVADEDLERENDEKTSSVHFLRFEFSIEQIAALKQGAKLSLGIDTPLIEPNAMVVLDPIRSALINDFDPAD
ncbi:MAG: DUF3501 family protein [Porticoccaceae bacterium]|jgi:hypothetical protein|nr:DUF3501 family protein [Porticoccaceae bacterium]MBT3798780.1 DUF3501 family protein [Porticoccaceae bacterium]MBT4163933.1 DUF3501 family protein [Porticoccaceae bacterium]MBT4210272.1 DUF3501 family protein [Porticoccaceae bacterium]MBT4591063.1 DUF3501 family protein [Porticoccaceae bacterium]